MSEEKPRLFAAAVVATLVIGVVAALLAVYHFRAPAPVVIKSPPEIKEVPKVVEKVVEKVVYKTEPAPPPLPEPPPEPPPPPPPQEETIQVKGVWDGVWRRNDNPLPMVRVKQSGDAVAGTFAANWGAVLPFNDGAADGDNLVFVVDDQMFRVHLRMTMLGDAKAKVEQWVSDSDWEISLERAIKTVRTPQQAAVVRAILERNARKYRKPVLIGIFSRQE